MYVVAERLHPIQFADADAVWVLPTSPGQWLQLKRIHCIHQCVCLQLAVGHFLGFGLTLRDTAVPNRHAISLVQADCRDPAPNHIDYFVCNFRRSIVSSSVVSVVITLMTRNAR